MIKREENRYKAECLTKVRLALPKFVVIGHQEYRQSGVPDVSITGYGHTTWWEFKHGTPDFDSTGIQNLTMRRLDAAGFARYVIYQETETQRRTMIVEPRYLDSLDTKVWCAGFDHQFVIDFIKRVHG